MADCPYMQNSSSVSCFPSCKAERLQGKWKVCFSSRYDPVPASTIELYPTNIMDEEGNELFEIYQDKQYCGSCYASSEEDARNKAKTGQLIELVG